MLSQPEISVKNETFKIKRCVLPHFKIHSGAVDCSVALSFYVQCVFFL